MTTPEKIFRWAEPCDHMALGQLMFDAIHAEPSPYTEAERLAWRSEPHAGPDWQSRLSGQRVLIAEDSHGPVGFMTLRPDGYVDLGYVLPCGRGQGWFRELYKRIETEATSQGLAALTTHASLAAEGPFIAVGFDVTDRETVDIKGQQLQRAAMHKLLAPR